MLTPFFILINISINFTLVVVYMAETFDKFIILHEKRMLTKDVDKMENNIVAVTNRASSALGRLGGKEMDKAVKKIFDGLEEFQNILAKHEMYDKF